MFPSKEEATKELEIAGQMNPGPWTKHSYNVAKAAEIIAENCKDLNVEKAYILRVIA